MRRRRAAKKARRRLRKAQRRSLNCSARSIASIFQNCVRGRFRAGSPSQQSSIRRATGVRLSERCNRVNAGEGVMYIKTKDGVEIYYKDWGKGQPIVFSHGWPLSADDWDNQMLFFGQRGFRVIAHDRRGHGRSSQGWDGHDMDHYADDLAALIAHLDLKNVIHVGHSTGGPEVVPSLARHGESRVAKAAIISAVPPLM